MVELSPGSVVKVVAPAPVVAYSAPGIVKNLWLKEGPAGPPGEDGEVTTAAMNAAIATAIGDIEPADIGAQPSDADLTAIAALSTTAYGRTLLTLANQAALVALLPSYQPLDSDLTSIAALSTTTYGRALLTLADQAALVALLPSYQPLDSDLTAIAALTTTSYGRAFLALADAAAARTALALGDTATKNTGTSTGTVAAGDDSRITGAAQKSANLSDLANPATARGNIEAAGSTGGGREKVAALSAVSGTATGDLSAASIFTITPSGNITLAFTNVPATGTACTVTVVVTQTSTVRTVTMPSGAYPVGAAYPTQVANKRCWFTLVTIDGGTTWAVSGAVEQ